MSEPQDEFERDAKRLKDLLLELQSTANAHAQTYTTVVIFGGYAALFATWTFTKEHLSATQSYWVGLLLGVSVLVFVLFEIFRMVMMSIDALQIRSLLVRELPPEELFSERARIAKASAMLYQRFVIPLWVASLVVSVLAGVGAAVFLFGAFAIGLAAGTL